MVLVSSLLRALASRFQPQTNRDIPPRCHSAEESNCWLQADPNAGADQTWGYVGVRLTGPSTITPEYLQGLSLRLAEHLPIAALRMGVLSRPLPANGLQSWLPTQQRSGNATLSTLAAARVEDPALQAALRERLGYLILRFELPDALPASQFEVLHRLNQQVALLLSLPGTDVEPLTAADLDLIDAVPVGEQPLTWRIEANVGSEPLLATVLSKLDVSGTVHVQLTAIRASLEEICARRNVEMREAYESGHIPLRVDCVLQLRSAAESIQQDQRLRTELHRLGWTATSLKGLPAGWPAPSISKRWPWATALTMSSLLPVLPTLVGQSPAEGGMLLRATTGEPRGFSPFAGWSDNHTLVIGQAGSGVSFTMAELLSSHLAEGGVATVFDDCGSYRRLAEAVGGQIISVGETGPLGLDPLPLIADMSSLEDHQDTLVSWLSLLAHVSEEDYRARADLSTALLTAWAQAPGHLTLSRVQLQLAERAETRHLANELAHYVPGGLYGALFQGPPSYTRSHALMLVDTSALTQAPSFVLPTLLLQSFLQIPLWHPSLSRTLLVADHLGLLGAATNFTQVLLRHMRRRRAGMLLGTQPGDVAADGPWGSLVPYISHRIYLSMSPVCLDHLLQTGVLTKEIRHLIRQNKTIKHRYARLVLQTADGASQFTLAVDATKMGMLSNCWQVRQRYEALRAEEMPVLEAARRAMDQ